MGIVWNKVTKLSQVVAIILFVVVFYLGMFLGRKVALVKVLGTEVSRVVFQCEANKSIRAVFYNDAVHVTMSDGPEYFLLHTISASGARYATPDESIVFWNKGNTAFMTEGATSSRQTYSGCVTN